jgi:hypothetical protein
MLTIIKDIDLINDIEKYDVILVGTNCYCNMSKGFQQKVKYFYKNVFELNLSSKYGDSTKIGKRISTKQGNQIFSLCFITNGFDFSSNKNKDYLDYSGLTNCLKTANNEYSGLKVATTLMGCEKFDGNGDREMVLKILSENSSKINLFVYDYIQKTTQEEFSEKVKELKLECGDDKTMFKQKYSEYKKSLTKSEYSHNRVKNRLTEIINNNKKLLNG